MENIWEHPYLGMGHILGTDRTLRAAGGWYVLMHQGAFPDFPTLSTHSSSVFMCLNYFKLHFGSWMCNDVEWYIYIIQQSLYRLTILQIWANITKRCQIHEPVAGVCPVAAAVWASGSACASRADFGQMCTGSGCKLSCGLGEPWRHPMADLPACGTHPIS
jgi:hypothetical protein